MTPRWLHWPAATGGWLPSDLTALFAWYDADALVGLSNGDPVSTWDDREASFDLTATGTDRPIYETNALNGKPVITFDGTRQIAASTASDWGFLHGQASGDKATVIMALRVGNTASPNESYAVLGTGTQSSAQVGMAIRYQNTLWFSANTKRVLLITNRGGGTGPLLESSTSFTFNTWHLLSTVFDNTNATLADRGFSAINGNSLVGANSANGTASTSNPAAALQLGSDNNGMKLKGAIAECCIFNDQLSDANREKVEGYLAHKWGLTANLPSTHPYKSTAP